MDTTILTTNEFNEPVKSEGIRKVYYAGFWMRFWAYLLDLIVISSINQLLIFPVFRFLDFPIAKEHMFTPIAILTALTMYVYFVLMTKFFRQTIGKMVFGLKVVNLTGGSLSWSTVLIREVIGKFISKTILLVGFLVVAFTPRNQGVHDLFSDTSVILERYSE